MRFISVLWLADRAGLKQCRRRDSNLAAFFRYAVALRLVDLATIDNRQREPGNIAALHFGIDRVVDFVGVSVACMDKKRAEGNGGAIGAGFSLMSAYSVLWKSIARHAGRLNAD